MLAFKGPAQASLTLGDSPKAGCGYLVVKCLSYGTHQTDVIRRSKTTPIHELERYGGAGTVLIQAQPPCGIAAEQSLLATPSGTMHQRRRYLSNIAPGDDIQ